MDAPNPDAPNPDAPNPDAPNPDAPNPNVQNIDVRMDLNDAGIMIKMEWNNMKSRFPNIELHEYVVMPNHFHAILEIVKKTPKVGQNNDQSQNGQPQGIAPDNAVKIKTIGDMMDAFKSITTVEYIRGVKKSGWKPFDGKLWQRNYYEHIIRNEQSYHRISEYIINNPAKWADDKFHKK